MRKFRKLLVFKFIGSVALFTLLSVMIAPLTTYAASVTAFSVLLTREKASTLSNQTITFTIPTAINASETIILTYNNSTSIPAALDFEDIDLADDAVDLVLAASPSGTTWGVVRTSSTVITFTNGSAAVASGSVVTIEIGTNATSVAAGVEQITNGSAGTTTLVLTGTMGTVDITGTQDRKS